MPKPFDGPVTDSMVERVAKALYMQAVKSGRDHVARKVFPLDKITDVFQQATTASDREAAIIIFCLIDDITTDFFRAKLTGKVPNGIEETFLSGNGMLATAHAKLSLLAGLEWVRQGTFRQLSLIRRIRNEFAHNVKYKNFDVSPIRDLINSMEASEVPVIATLPAESHLDPLPLRVKFLMRSGSATYHLIHDIAIIEAAALHGVNPASIGSSPFEDQPPNVQDLLRTVVRAILESSAPLLPPFG